MADQPVSDEGQRFVLTGPTGWIGRALLALMRTRGDPDALASGDCVALFGSAEGEVALADGTRLPVRPLAEISPQDVDGAHIIHLSFLTKDKVGTYGESEFRRINRSIDDAVLAALAQARPASIFVASSGAAHAAEQGLDDEPYGLAKLEQESRFLEYAQDGDVPIICGRIFNIAGAYTNKLEAYALSNFVLQALEGGPIRIAASLPVFRSFLHVNDLCRLILRCARRSITRERVIDLCGNEVLEMQDIAQSVASAFDDEISVQRPDLNFAEVSAYVGNCTELRTLALEVGLGLTGFQIQVRDTINWVEANRPIAPTGRLIVR